MPDDCYDVDVTEGLIREAKTIEAKAVEAEAVEAKGYVLKLSELPCADGRGSWVLVSAGATTSRRLQGPTGLSVRSDILLRDALANAARVFFDRIEPKRIVMRWDPALTPIALDVAARFGGGEGELVYAFVHARDQADHAQLLALADWRRGKLVLVDSPLSSDLAVSQAMGNLSLRAAIFLGGTNDVQTDADELTAGKRFAVASTGGAADRLLQSSVHDYTGGGGSQLNSELQQPGSYLSLFKKILSNI